MVRTLPETEIPVRVVSSQLHVPPVGVPVMVTASPIQEGETFEELKVIGETTSMVIGP